MNRGLKGASRSDVSCLCVCVSVSMLCVCVCVGGYFFDCCVETREEFKDLEKRRVEI